MIVVVLQALVNGLVSGTLLAVPAIGFTAMFAVLRFPNFSVSGVATLGAFAGYVAYGAGLQMAGSLVVAFAVAGGGGRPGRPGPPSPRVAFPQGGPPAAGQAGRAAGGHRLDRDGAGAGERRAAGLR